MSQTRPYIIYLPGLGDSYDVGRKFALRFWWLYGVRVELVPMRWSSETSFQVKYDRVLAAIERAETAGYDVSLIGESAGGSMALNVLASHPSTQQVVTICGVNSPDISIAPELQKRNPAFVESVAQLTSSLTKIDSTKITTLYSEHDPAVAHRFTKVPGAVSRRLPFTGHIFAIALTITVYAWLPTFIIKSSR